ncbi:MAG: 30S ribosomal protein S16 [Patescibacteria group bacterium]
MLVIRLRRVGKKNKPSYRVVVAEHSFPIDGRFVADLGFYNPHTKTASVKKDEAIEWMKKGAQPSNTIAKILEKEKVKHGSVVVIKKNKKSKAKIIEPKPVAAPVAVAEAPVGSPEKVTTEVTPETIEEPKAEEAPVDEPAEPAADEKKDS